jgi:hypothetical protein
MQMQAQNQLAMAGLLSDMDFSSLSGGGGGGADVDMRNLTGGIPTSVITGGGSGFGSAGYDTTGGIFGGFTPIEF